MKTIKNKYTSMRTIVSILAILLIAGCGSVDNQRIKKEIESKKTQILKLEKEIGELQKQLTDTVEKHNLIAVKVKEIQPEEFKHYITVFGNVEADKYAKISPEMNGQITKIHVSEGQRVNKGQLMLSLNTAITESSINEAKTGLNLATTTFERQKSLWDQKIGSEIQFLQAKAQKESAEARLKMLEAQLEMSQIIAPFDGIVDRIYSKVGELAGPGVPVIEFVNLAKLTVKADVSETYIEAIRPGETVDLSFSSLPDLKLKTKITRVAKVINPGSRTFNIELSINNQGEKIRPNMVSSIKINDYTSKDAYVVQTIVIKRDITGDYLYVATDKGNNTIIASKKYVTRGRTYEGLTEISSGLKPNDKVIESGYNLVSSGSYVTIY